MIMRSRALVFLLVGLLLLVVACAGKGGSPTASTTVPTSGVTTSDVTIPGSTDTTPTSTTGTSSPTTSTIADPGPAGTEVGSLRSMTAPSDDLPVVSSTGDGGSANILTSSPECDVATPGRTATDLAWATPQDGGEQRIDLTAFFRGFESGDFVATPTLPPGQTSYRLLDTEPGAQYEWRVLTRSRDGWVASQSETFRGAACIVDAP